MRKPVSFFLVLLTAAVGFSFCTQTSAAPFKSKFKRRVVGDLPKSPTSQAKPATPTNAHAPVFTAPTQQWSNTRDKLNHPTNTNPQLDWDDFVEYLEELEDRYRGENWQKIIAALHAELYGIDVNGKMPVPWNWDRFLHGPDSDGYRKIAKTLAGKNKNGQPGFTRYTPKFVIGPNGEKIDIGHAYAGLRSDLNRDPGKWRRFMRWTQTDGGDSWQTWMHWDNNYAPPHQRRGNALGVWLATFYEQPGNENVPLSQAFRRYFEQVKKEANTPKKKTPVEIIPRRGSSGRSF